MILDMVSSVVVTVCLIIRRWCFSSDDSGDGYNLGLFTEQDYRFIYSDNSVPLVAISPTAVAVVLLGSDRQPSSGRSMKKVSTVMMILHIRSSLDDSGAYGTEGWCLLKVQSGCRKRGSFISSM